MKVLDLFSGIGGFSLGLERAGMKTVAFCESDKNAQKVLKKHWPDVTIHNDVRFLDGKKYRGSVDVVCGGFPCQDLSKAGFQKGFSGERSSLYTQMLMIVSECMPRFAIFENVTNLIIGEQGRWFGKFLYDLAEIGFDAEWHCIPGSAVGAAHHRDRVWVIAYPNGSVPQGLEFQKPLRAYTEESRRRELARAVDAALPANDYTKVRGDIDDVSGIMEQLRQYGNSVIPLIPEIIGCSILAQQSTARACVSLNPI